MRHLTFILLFLVTSLAYGKRPVVIDMESFLVTSVPDRFRTSSSEPREYIVFDKRTTYRIYPHSVAVLEKLIQNPQLEVFLFSEQKSPNVDSILNKVPTKIGPQKNLFDYIGNGLTVLSSKSMPSHLKDALFITKDNKSSLSSNLLLVPDHYFYENEKTYNSEKKNYQSRSNWSKHASSIPTDENEWNLSLNRALIVYEKILHPRAASDNELFQKASTWASNGYTDLSYSWQSSKGKVQCLETNIRTARKSFPALERCLEKVPVIKAGINKVDNCYFLTPSLEIITKANDCPAYQIVLKDSLGKLSLKTIGPPAGKLSLFHLNRDEQMIDGIQYPRTNLNLYRGMKANQYDIPQALRAFFGDSFAGVESKNLTAFKNYLLSTPSPVKVDLEYMGFKSILDNTNTPGNREEAKIAAFSILDDNLSSLSDSEKRDSYLNYNSYKYQDWSADLVFGTVYYGGAAIYGDIIVTFKDYEKRGVDLNWYNKGAMYPADLGEYVLPLEIKPTDLVGIQKKSLKESFYKVTYKGKPYVLVFGNQYTCLDHEDSDQIVYTCAKQDTYNSFYSSGIYTKPAARYDQAIPKAILALCLDVTKCSVPSELRDHYKVESEMLSPSSQQMVDEFELNGMKLKVIQ